MPKEEEEMKAVEALSRAMLGSFRNLHMQIQVIHVIQFSHVFPLFFFLHQVEGSDTQHQYELERAAGKVCSLQGWLDSVG